LHHGLLGNNVVPIRYPPLARTHLGGCGTVQGTRTASYDGANRVAQMTSAEGRPTSYGYDAAGQLTSVTQRVVATNAATAITVNLGYDRKGNKTRMVDGNGNATITTFNTWGLPESTSNHPPPRILMRPTARGRQSTMRQALAWKTVFPARDAKPHLRRVGPTHRRDRSRRYHDGPQHRLRRRWKHRLRGISGRNLSYIYNDRGQLASAGGYGGTASYTYDAEGKLATRTDATGSATFGYDDAGRPTSTTDPLTATTVSTTYDTAGRPSTTCCGTGNATRNYTYDNLGRLDTDSRWRPNSTVSTSVDFDLDNLLTKKRPPALPAPARTPTPTTVSTACRRGRTRPAN
jgi:YD repeat-containing protein